MLTDTQFEKIPAHDIVGIRVILQPKELTELYARGFDEILKMLTVEGIEPAGTARAYYFGEISDTVDILVGFPVGPEQAETLRRGALSQSGGDIDDIALHHFRGMKVFHSRHTGAYEGLEQTWTKAFDDIESMGCRLPKNTVGWEEFVNGPAASAAVEELITDVYVQVCHAPEHAMG